MNFQKVGRVLVEIQLLDSDRGGMNNLTLFYFYLLLCQNLSMKKSLIAENYGDFISISKENVILKNKDVIEISPLKELSQVIIKGAYVSFSSAVILKCLKNGISIILLDNLGRPYSVIGGLKRINDSKERQTNFSNSQLKN